MTDEFADELIISTLKFWIRKIRRGDCTREEKMLVAECLGKDAETYGTVDDLASHYGKTKEAIYGLIKRKYVGKKKRNVVMYSFPAFDKIVPNSWRRKREESTR